MNIALCGMMGCGKTTVAKILAEKFNKSLKDTDEIIVGRYGTIADIFAQKGEEYFRKIEAEVIAEISSKDGNFVIALGGGAVLREENVRNLKRYGKIVYLRTEEENLVKRLEKTTDRPLLQGTMRDRISQIMRFRAPIYENAADFVIDTDGLSPQKIAIKIGEIIL